MIQLSSQKTEANFSRARVGIISEKLPGLTPGGAEAIAAWMAQALQGYYQVTLLVSDTHLSLVDLDRLFGTSLTGSTLAVRYMPLPWWLPQVVGLRTLKHRILAPYYHRIAEEFDLLINASGEGRFKYPGIQYINFPRAFLDVPSDNPIRLLYRKLLDLFPWDPGTFSDNLTLTNSNWAATQIGRAYGIPSTVLTPPIAFSHALLPWQDRERGFLIVGRLSPEKRVEAAFEILSSVRRRGYDIHLHVVGGADHRGYTRFIKREARRYGDWITLEGQVTRQRLEELIIRHQYGIHCMPEEHFGMAAAEMIRGGCIVFVPNGGGQVEVVGDPLSIYASLDDAVEKICTVLASREEQNRLLTVSASSAALTQPEEFCRAFLHHCRTFLIERDRRASTRHLNPAPSSS